MTVDLFDSQTVVGLKVKLDRVVDREKPSCRNICTIGAGKGPHAGELICVGCGRHRGWLSKATAQWIEHVATRFGARTTPGASDFLLWHQGNSFALELKAPGDRPTEAQLEFLARFNEAGGHSACAEDVDRAVAVLESWQPLRGARRHPRTSFSGASPQCCGKDEATALPSPQRATRFHERRKQSCHVSMKNYRPPIYQRRRNSIYRQPSMMAGTTQRPKWHPKCFAAHC